MRVDPERLRPSDVPEQVGDPSRLRALTGWQPRIPIEQTLRDLLDDWRAARCALAAPAPAMKLLLTGATGFLGRDRRAPAEPSAATRCACWRGPTSRLAGLPEGCEAAIGDVADAASLRRAAEGCEAVLHMAALVKIWVSRSRPASTP